MLSDFLAHQTRELVVDGVAGACGNDASLDGLADQGHVTNDVKEFMARAFVVPHEWLVLDISDLLRIDMGNL